MSPSLPPASKQPTAAGTKPVGGDQTFAETADVAAGDATRSGRADRDEKIFDDAVKSKTSGEPGEMEAPASLDGDGFERPAVVVTSYGSNPTQRTKKPIDATWLLTNIFLPLLILTAGVAAIVLFGTVEPGRKPEPDRSPIGLLKALPPVRTVQVRSLAASGQRLQLQTDGEVVPYREAEVAAEVAGRIISKQPICEAGQYVLQGQQLMQIDRTDLELEVESLQRSQEQAYEALKEIDEEVAGSNRLIDVAKRDVQLQIREVRRQRSLPEGFNTGRDIDAAEKALLVAEQALVTLENRISSLKVQRSKFEAAERLAATQLRVAEVNLKRTTIVAPIDGVIVSENVDVDTFVQRGTPLVTIETTDKVEIDSKLRSDQLYWVLNQRVEQADADSTGDNGNRFAGYQLPQTDAIISFELSGLENQIYRWKGRLVSYDGIGLDPQTRTVPVRILVDNPRQNVDEDGNPIAAPGAPALVRGMFVSVLLQIEPTANLVLIPANAMQPGNRVLQFVADDGVLRIDDQTVEEEKATDAESIVDNASTDDESKDVEVAVSDDAGENMNSTTANEGGSSDQSDESIFDPEAWVAGRVIVTKNVTPIDSLRTDDAETMNNSAMGSERKYWVCEVAEETLSDGSLVVVSPIGNFDGDGMPARTAVETEGSAEQSDAEVASLN